MESTPAFVFIGVAAAAALLAGYASWVVLRANFYSGPSKLAQLALVWLVPIVGPLVCLVFRKIESSPLAARSPEFYENVDASGSDH